MKSLNENERILTAFGGLLVLAALSLSVATEVSTRKHLAEHQQPLTGIIQQGTPSRFEKHIAYEQQTLSTRWAVPDGHATLGVAFAAFGMVLIAVPRAVAKKRGSG